MTPPETSVGTMTYSLEQAAGKLGGPFTVDFLKKNLHRLPHLKLGSGTGRAGRVGFSDRHLQQIIALFTVDPGRDSQLGEFPSMVTRRRGDAAQRQPGAAHPSRAASGPVPRRRSARAAG